MSKVTVYTTAKKRRKWTDKDKADHVWGYLQSGKSMNEFAESIGITGGQLHTWCEKFKKAPKSLPEPSSGLPSTITDATPMQLPVPSVALSSEFTALKEENERLKVRLSHVEAAYGRKLVELDMARLTHVA